MSCTMIAIQLAAAPHILRSQTRRPCACIDKDTGGQPSLKPRKSIRLAKCRSSRKRLILLLKSKISPVVLG